MGWVELYCTVIVLTQLYNSKHIQLVVMMLENYYIILPINESSTAVMIFRNLSGKNGYKNQTL